jgi:PAS domain S-box-containing protein
MGENLSNSNVKELHLTAAYLTTLIQTIPDLVWMKDMDGTFVYCNRLMCRLLGASEEDIIGKTDFSFFDPDTARVFRNFDLRAMKEGKPTANEEWVTFRDDGKLVLLETIKTPVYDSAGIVIGVLGIGHDITERKRIEETHRLQHEALAKLNRFSIELSKLTVEDNLEVFITRSIKEISGAIAATFSVYDPDTHTTTTRHIELEAGMLKKVADLITDQAKKTHSVVTEEMYREMTTDIIGIKKTIYEASLGAIPKPLAATMQRLLKADRVIGIAYMVEGELYGTSLLGMRKDQPDPSREILQNFISLTATSMRRNRAEIALRNKNEELVRINSAKDKFFSVVAHDLRNPFQALLGLTGILADDPSDFSPEEIKNISQAVRQSATNLYRLLENLLEWSRMQRGATDFRPEPMVLLPRLTESMEAVLEPARKKGISVIYDIPEDLQVFADWNMLGSCIRNLASNAVKFSNPGGEINLAAKPVKGGFVEISVRDSGIGMKPDMVEKLFILDDQKTRKGTSGEPGSGLGLLICRDFIERHGGTIRVETEEGKGTTFRFTISRKPLLVS